MARPLLIWQRCRCERVHSSGAGLIRPGPRRACLPPPVRGPGALLGAAGYGYRRLHPGAVPDRRTGCAGRRRGDRSRAASSAAGHCAEYLVRVPAGAVVGDPLSRAAGLRWAGVCARFFCAWPMGQPSRLAGRCRGRRGGRGQLDRAGRSAGTAEAGAGHDPAVELAEHVPRPPGGRHGDARDPARCGATRPGYRTRPALSPSTSTITSAGR